MRNLKSTERSNQCVHFLFDKGRKCNKAGFSVFHGTSGPFYRCRACTMLLAKQCDDVYLDGELISEPK